MDVEIGRVDSDEQLAGFLRCASTAFGTEERDADRPLVTGFLERERLVAAYDAGSVVGTGGVLSLALTVAGPATVPCGGLTMVTVLPTHRRRGILTRMMGRMLDDAAARGEPVVALIASEAVIYGRFGFGLATTTAVYELERRHAALVHPPVVGGRFRLIEREEAEAVLPAVFERVCRGRVGEVSRGPGWWARQLADRPDDRGGLSRAFFVVHEAATGEPDGYAIYRLRQRWDATPEHTLHLQEVAAADPAVRLALVAFCCDVDLVSRVRLEHFPVDEPLRHALADPRRLKCVSLADHLWVRVLDVPAALSARTYGTEGRVVLEVADSFRPASGGRFVVEGSPEGGSCRRADDVAPELLMTAADLGACYLGGTSLVTLAAAGRVREVTPGALARAEAMFRTAPAPYCDTDF